LPKFDAHEIIFVPPLNGVAKQWQSAYPSAMADFVQSLRSEIDALEQSIRTSPDPRALKLRELKKVLALYLGRANSRTVDAEPVHPSDLPGAGRVSAGQTPGRKISPQRQAAIEATIIILKQAMRPLKTSALYEMIRGLGASIGGADPVNNYSALLYARDEFQSHGREGWTLKEELLDTNDAMPAQDIPRVGDGSHTDFGGGSAGASEPHDRPSSVEPR
jgi:hypothetical protein